MNDVPLTAREQRGLTLAANPKLKQLGPCTWLVPSESSKAGYVVDTDEGSCTCPDHELRGDTVVCKHQLAVRYALQIKKPVDPGRVKRPTYKQDWPNYNAAQVEEKDKVQILAQSLCDTVHNPPQPGRGRRRLALSNVIFSAIMKTFGGLSVRRSMSDIRSCAKDGLLDRAPSYNAIFEYLENPDVTPVLKRLVRVSATPLAGVEKNFAIDGTGFGSKVYKRWFDAKYGREMKEATWVKLHAVCGATTNVITAAEVTDAYMNDCPFLPGLTEKTAESFTVAEMSADKGYLAAANMEAIEAVGGVPYIAFKTNSKPGKVDVWRRAYHMFALHKEEWLKRYHLRSNIEATFSAMKRKFGGSVRSKKPDAMFNEVLLKVITHNLSCLVHASRELGIDPQLWGDVQ